MGPNGSGKSTLFLRHRGHPKYRVTSGSITLDGADVLAMSIDERARAGVFWPCSIRSRCPGLGVELPALSATAIRGEGPSCGSG